MIILKILTPFICAIFFRLGGVGKNDRFLPFMEPPCKMANNIYRSLGIACVIALVKWNWIYLISYGAALNLFFYGENYWIRKLLGPYPCWLIFGFMFGLASLNWLNALWSAAVFTILMHLSNTGIPVNDIDEDWKLDHAYVEVGIGFAATLWICG